MSEWGDMKVENGNIRGQKFMEGVKEEGREE